MNEPTVITSLRARLNGWRSLLAGWLRRFADRLDSDLGVWLWLALFGFVGLCALALSFVF